MASKRELIQGKRGGRRFVRRNTKGQFKEVDDAGRSLAADRRRRAKKTTTSGQGDRGDRRPAGGSKSRTRRSTAQGRKRAASGRTGRTSGSKATGARTGSASPRRQPSRSPAARAGTDAVAMLKQQHREVEALFKRIEKMGDGEAMDMRALFQEIDQKLTMHAAIEEKHFYPAVRAAQTEELVSESFEEHATIKRQLAELRALSHADRSFESRIEELKECVEHHAKEEEEAKLFPKVKKLLDSKQLQALAAQMRATMQRLEGAGARESTSDRQEMMRT